MSPLGIPEAAIRSLITSVTRLNFFSLMAASRRHRAVQMGVELIETRKPATLAELDQLGPRRRQQVPHLDPHRPLPGSGKRCPKRDLPDIAAAKFQLIGQKLPLNI